MHEIYQFDNIYSYLSFVFSTKKERNQNFSLTAWSKQLGLKSHGPLQQILSGQRKVPKNYVPLFIQNLKLDEREGHYFEAMVDLDRAKNEAEKAYCFHKLMKLTPPQKQVHFHEINSIKYFESPLHAQVKTLMERSDFIFDPYWIQSKLRKKVLLSDISICLQRLVDLGLVEVMGEKVQIKQDHTSNIVDVPSRAVQTYHTKMLQEAAEALLQQSVEEREFNSFSFNIKPDQMPKAKKSIREFIDKFLTEFEAERGESTQTVNLNMQLFQLTK